MLFKISLMLLFWSSPFPNWSLWLFLGLLGIAVHSDITLRKVPNVLNGALILSGLLLQVWINGLEGLIVGCLGLLVALLTLIIPFALYLYRGGDVKLCMGIGVWIGAKMVAFSIVVGVILGGLFGALMLIQHRMSASGEKAKLTVPMALPFCLSCIGLLCVYGWPSFQSIWG